VESSFLFYYYIACPDVTKMDLFILIGSLEISSDFVLSGELSGVESELKEMKLTLTKPRHGKKKMGSNTD
jgi:hypothetical protein